MATRWPFALWRARVKTTSLPAAGSSRSGALTPLLENVALGRAPAGAQVGVLVLVRLRRGASAATSSSASGSSATISPTPPAQEHRSRRRP